MTSPLIDNDKFKNMQNYFSFSKETGVFNSYVYL